MQPGPISITTLNTPQMLLTRACSLQVQRQEMFFTQVGLSISWGLPSQLQARGRSIIIPWTSNLAASMPGIEPSLAICMRAYEEQVSNNACTLLTPPSLMESHQGSHSAFLP